jgi:hypothetical protein
MLDPGWSILCITPVLGLVLPVAAHKGAHLSHTIKTLLYLSHIRTNNTVYSFNFPSFSISLWFSFKGCFEIVDATTSVLRKVRLLLQLFLKQDLAKN